MKKKILFSIVFILSQTFHAERHITVTTYDGNIVEYALDVTDCLLVSKDSLSLAGTDGTLLLHESLSKIRSLAVHDVPATSIDSERLCYDTDSILSDHAEKSLEGDRLYIYKGNQKFTITGVQIQ